MKLVEHPRSHLCYCTNIHPGESWAEVRSNLERHVLAVKQRVSPRTPFGVGLRLSARAADELAAGDALDELRDWLAASGLYVFTINGFAHGRFHGGTVKHAVYRPDWLEPERLVYTDLLARLLAELLPDDADTYGSISTVPGAFHSRIDGDSAVQTIAEALLAHAATLERLRDSTGKTVALALEPEPCCYLETVEETVEFFENHLFSNTAIAGYAERTGLDRSGAETSLHRHLGVCLDTCHAAVEFEQVGDIAKRLGNAGIAIHKLQLSTGLQLDGVDQDQLGQLSSFADDVYLHQVVERRGGRLTRYLDLPDALDVLEHSTESDAAGKGRQWRVHCHVPLFLEKLGSLANTQTFLAEVLDLHAVEPLSAHLEVETYTWEVLPAELRTGDVDTAIARELAWVIDRLARAAR